MPWPRRGSLTSVATAHGAVDRPQNIGCLRHDELLHDGREGNGRELGADPLNRGVEPVERLVLDDSPDLGAEPAADDGLMGDDAAVRLLDRADERRLVERL